MKGNLFEFREGKRLGLDEFPVDKEADLRASDKVVQVADANVIPTLFLELVLHFEDGRFAFPARTPERSVNTMAGDLNQQREEEDSERERKARL